MMSAHVAYPALDAQDVHVGARALAASGVYAQEAADRIIMAEARRRCQ